jgi:hypothetical protein
VCVLTQPDRFEIEKQWASPPLSTPLRSNVTDNVG